MFALLVLPLADKAMHDFKHLNDEHCSITDVHYCQAEHVCSICDYVFSASAVPPKTEEHLTVYSKPGDEFISYCVFNNTISLKFILSFRGPPATT
jgi:hypothetical protein